MERGSKTASCSSRLNRFLPVSWVLLISFCLLSSPVHSIPTGYAALMSLDVPDVLKPVNGTSTLTTYSDKSLPDNSGALNILLEYDGRNDAGPVCYLQIEKNITTNISQWTKPCPRSRQLLPVFQGPISVWCKFEFDCNGNLLLTGGTNTTVNGSILWTSNTGGMGATSLEILTTDASGVGNLVLYNIKNEIVWQNIANNPGSEDYQCTDNKPVPTMLASAPSSCVRSPPSSPPVAPPPGTDNTNAGSRLLPSATVAPALLAIFLYILQAAFV